MITVTETAAQKIKEISEAEGLAGQALRVKVVGGGCAGFSYDLHFETDVSEMDEQFDSNGVKVVVDPLSMQYLEGVEIDYLETLTQQGFKFNNPNSTGSCGCNKSFRV